MLKKHFNITTFEWNGKTLEVLALSLTLHRKRPFKSNVKVYGFSFQIGGEEFINNIREFSDPEPEPLNRLSPEKS